uniref:YqaJ viral recombinase domain-containing protein n=1 Tax=viral metagenome TaxID=1070528 RepID=A0A6C0KEE3_9ZZZZ
MNQTSENALIQKINEIPQFKQKSQEWLSQRMLYLTSSDAASAMGINPYSKPEELLFKKCGIAVPFSGNVATRHGEKYEDEAIEKYCKAFGMKNYEFGLIPYEKVRRENPIESYKFLAGSPDGLAVPLNNPTEEPILLEVKCPYRRKPVRGCCPDYYYPQVQLNMLICDVKRAHFIEYLPFAEASESLTVTAYEIDHAYLSKWIPVLQKFWGEVMDYRDNGSITEHKNYSKWSERMRKAKAKLQEEKERDDADQNYMLGSDSD